MKWFGCVMALMLVAGCGVDGEPVPPTMNTTIGVGVSEHGVRTSTSVSATTGNVTVGVGVGL